MIERKDTWWEAVELMNKNETDIKALKGEVEDNRQRLRYLDGGSEVGEGFVLGETTKLSHRIDNLTKEVEALKGYYDGMKRWDKLHPGRLVNVDQAIARLSTRFRAREADTGHFDEIFEDNREAIADLTEKVDEMERVWRGEDECVSGDLEDIGKRVEALENDSLMQYEMDKPDPDPPEEEV